jgi:hypothetical protein
MVQRILRAPAQIVVAPSSLAGAYPFGGTAIGRTREVAFVEQGGPGRRIESELLGEATDVLESANVASFGCFIRGWDDDALELLMSQGYAEGSETLRATYTSPGGRTPGQTAVDRAVVLLIAPENPADAPALLLHRFVPFWDSEATLHWSRQEELGIPLAGECLRGANGRIYDIGRLPDLSLD